MKKLSLEDLEVESFAVQPSEGELALVMGGGKVWDAVKGVWKWVSGSNSGSKDQSTGKTTSTTSTTGYQFGSNNKNKGNTYNYYIPPCDSAKIDSTGTISIYGVQ